jgi:hypothetical protein
MHKTQQSNAKVYSYLSLWIYVEHSLQWKEEGSAVSRTVRPSQLLENMEPKIKGIVITFGWEQNHPSF